jgi:hypothetical protein
MKTCQNYEPPRAYPSDVLRKGSFLGQILAASGELLHARQPKPAWNASREPIRLRFCALYNKRKELVTAMQVWP